MHVAPLDQSVGGGGGGKVRGEHTVSLQEGEGRGGEGKEEVMLLEISCAHLFRRL